MRLELITSSGHLACCHLAQAAVAQASSLVGPADILPVDSRQVAAKMPAFPTPSMRRGPARLAPHARHTAPCGAPVQRDPGRTRPALRLKGGQSGGKDAPFTARNIPVWPAKGPFSRKDAPFSPKDAPFPTRNVPFSTKDARFPAGNVPFWTRNVPFSMKEGRFPIRPAVFRRGRDPSQDNFEAQARCAQRPGRRFHLVIRSADP
jgi:hypothetical protein